MKRFLIVLSLMLCLFSVSADAETSNFWRVEAENTVDASHAVYIDNNGDASSYSVGVGIDQSASYVLYYENVPASNGISMTYATPHTGSVFVAYQSGDTYVSVGSLGFSATAGWAFNTGVKTSSLTGISIPENARVRVTANAPVNIDYFTFTMNTPKTMETITVNIVPEPAKIRHEGVLGSGYVADVYPATIGTTEESFLGAVSAFSLYAKRLAGISFTEGDAITVSFDATLPVGGYRIVSKDQKIKVFGADEEGVSAGLSTLCQTIAAKDDGFKFLKGEIMDYPDSLYRSIMIDVARKYHPIDYLFKYVDICYLNKLNCFHLHLTDTEGYRLPSKAYPKLTSVDGAYSYTEIAALVRYAKERGITIIPEIEMPGHCQHLQAKYPEVFGSTGILCAEEHTFNAMKTILDEVAEMFPYSKYIHVGGDEANYHAYANCAGCNHSMKAYGIDNYGTLYAYFVGRAAQMVLDMGRTPIVWEGFHKDNNSYIPKETIVNCFELYYQTPDSLLNAGFTIINCAWNPNYIVAPKTSWTFDEIYANPKTKFTPIYGGSPYYPNGYQAPENAKILGSQICAWGDYLRLYDHAEAATAEEFGYVKPRATALAERMWNGKRARRTAAELYSVYANYVAPREDAACISNEYIRVEGESAEGNFVMGSNFAAIDAGYDTPTTMRYRLFFKDTPKATKLRFNYGTLLPGKLLICLKEGDTFRNLTSVDFSATSDWEIFEGYAETTILQIPEGSELAIFCVSGSININYIDFIYDETRIFLPGDAKLPSISGNTMLLTDCVSAKSTGSGSDAWTPKVRTTASGQSIGEYSNYISMTTGCLASSSYIEYDIQKTSASNFCALVFVKGGTVPEGQSAKAVFTVMADGVPVAVSAPLMAGDAPVILSAEIYGKKTLRLCVSPVGEYSSIECIWADPILARMPQYTFDYAKNFQKFTVEAEDALEGSSAVKINAAGGYDNTNVHGMAIDGVGSYYLYYDNLPAVESVYVRYASATSGAVFFDYYDEEKEAWVYVGSASCTTTNAWGWQNAASGTAFLCGVSIPPCVKIRVTANFSVNIDAFNFISRHVEPVENAELSPSSEKQVTALFESHAIQCKISSASEGKVKFYVVQDGMKYEIASVNFASGSTFVYLSDLLIPENATIIMEASTPVSLSDCAFVIAHEKCPEWSVSVSKNELQIYKKEYAPKDACVLVVDYDADGRLIGIERFDTTLTQGTRKFPLVKERNNTKVYLWTALDALNPII